MNTEVNYEIAKLLKEKGFDLPTNKYYEHALTSKKDSETNDFTGAFGWKKGETNLNVGFFRNNGGMADLSNENWYMCSAPTIAEVIMWLYEKHGIWIDVTLNQFSKPNDLKWMYSIVFTEERTYSHSQKSFNSPTESYLSAIKYYLKDLV